MARATLRLTLDCDNRCTFCGQAGLAPAEAERPLAERLHELRANAEELSFVGGEPTLAPGLPAAVRAAREAGFTKVGVQTNGRRLADLPYANSLIAAGLTDAQVTVLGDSPAAHDFHTGVDGSFDALLKGVAHARAKGLVVVAATVLTRSNFRELSGLPELLRARGLSAWLLALPRVAGRAADHFDRVIPRLGMALPYALQALALAAKIGLPAWIRGAPLCALGPFSRRVLSEPPRAFGETCQACAARAICPGLDPPYLARFGEDELSPASASPARDAPDALARLFVGEGELSARPSLRVAPCPAQSRSALALHEKVTRATGEATQGAPRRSGEALKELFPQLYDDAKQPPR